MADLTKIIVHKFTMGDVEDPDLYAADPIWKWQQTQVGKFVMKHADKTIWVRNVDHNYHGYRYYIVAEFDERSLVEYYLRGGEDHRDSYFADSED